MATPGSPVSKLDLLGSTLQVGIWSTRHDRAVRRALVTDLENDADALNTAIFETVAVAGVYHHQRPNLPLQRVRATKFGPNKAWVTLMYGRDRFTIPTASAKTAAQLRGTADWIDVYLATTDELGNPTFGDNGLPGQTTGISQNWQHASEQNLQDQAWKPVAYSWRRPTIRLLVTTVLDFNPYWLPNQIGTKLGKINSDTITFDGLIFTPNTVRFDSAEVSFTEGTLGAPNSYAVDYQFTIVRGKWASQRADFNSNAGTVSEPAWKYPDLPTGRWVVVEDNEYEEAAFADAFPVH